MDKILISNSFKNLLQSLGAKDTSNLSNIGSKAVPVVDTASGSAGALLGYSTMSTLASVLGGVVTASTNNDVDLDDYKTAGTYMFNNGTSGIISNIPFTGTDFSQKVLTLIVVKTGGWCYQIAFSPVTRNCFFFRCFNERWYNWFKVEGTEQTT